MLDVDQLDWVIDIQWDGDDIVSVEVAIEDTGRNGVAVQTNQEIEEGGTVADHDRLFVMLLGEDLF